YHAPQTDGKGVEGLRGNLRQAVALLQEAGWQWKDGRMVNAKGNPFKFEILINDSLDERIALEYSRALRRIGVTVSLRTVDTAQYIGRLSDFDFDATFNLWKNSLSPGTEQGVFWGSRAALQPGSFNYSGLQSPAIDALIDRLTRTTRYDVLTQVTHALDRVLMHSAFGVPLYYAPYDMVAYRNRLAMPETTPIFGPIPESWWEKPSEK
ncbi:MAG TPA: ABC transporter substrate-binding protein, partial [Alphaproteobacteria bacterium]